MEKEVHKIKSTLSMIGLTSTREKAIEIELLTHSQADNDRLEMLTNEFCSCIEQAMVDLKELGY